MAELAFVYSALPARVVFGNGTIVRVREEAERLAITRALVLTTPAQRTHGDQLAAQLTDRAAGVFAGAAMHTPIEVTEAALAVVRDVRADGVIALGGGSTIGLGKAIAVRTGLPQLAIPTTYAGSEMTPILGETARGEKTTRSSLDILPETVIYDVELTLGLPPALSATSGINAIAHAAEALYAVNGNPVIAMFAEQAISALARALPVIVREPPIARASARVSLQPSASRGDQKEGDRMPYGLLEARRDALYGAWLAGTCLGVAGMALHHKLCHVLGGTFGLPHAETHTAVLPHAIAYNAAAAPAAMATIARALGRSDGDAARGLHELAGAVGAERALARLGMPEAGLDRAADLAAANPYANPRPIERAAIRDLLARAFTGAAPHA